MSETKTFRIEGVPLSTYDRYRALSTELQIEPGRPLRNWEILVRLIDCYDRHAGQDGQ